MRSGQWFSISRQLMTSFSGSPNSGSMCFYFAVALGR